MTRALLNLAVSFSDRDTRAKTQFMYSEDDQDEVSFWLAMIHQWETSHAEPVPKRMREALELAELKKWHAEGIEQRKRYRIH